MNSFNAQFDAVFTLQSNLTLSQTHKVYKLETGNFIHVVDIVQRSHVDRVTLGTYATLDDAFNAMTAQFKIDEQSAFEGAI